MPATVRTDHYVELTNSGPLPESIT